MVDSYKVLRDCYIDNVRFITLQRLNSSLYNKPFIYQKKAYFTCFHLVYKRANIFGMQLAHSL